ncbi:hypothetical protein F0M16_10370 [Vibrio cholerae]|uniref:Uncharacterized protein n=1 Tax=Vibrio cholerae TaxID=666 RepID=A0A5Q6PIG0_VIBCL|nr:hypothetical protein [Vibrio cholerae]KAA1254662.1 hypothetical protein F0M16_10370 [Vibrio cholerae]
MPRSKPPRKNRKKILSTGERCLNNSWLAMYNQMKFVDQMLIDKNGNMKKSHVLFNKLLLEYLDDCQKESYLPSKDALEDKCQEIFYFASNKVQFTNIEPNRMELDHLLDAIERASLEVFNKKQEDGKYIVDGYLIVDCRNLSQDETNYVIKKFNANYDNELDSLTYQCLEYPIRQFLTPQKERKVRDFCVKKGKQDLIRLFNNDFQLTMKIEESILERIRDKWFLFTL